MPLNQALFCIFASLLLSASGETIYEPYSFTTVAGAAPTGTRDGVGSKARFPGFKSITADQNGNVYVLDDSGLRQVTSDGFVTTLARGEFSSVAVNPAGEVYVTSKTGAVGQVSSAGTIFYSSRIPVLGDIVFDGAGNLYGRSSNVVLKLPPQGAPTVVASTDAIRSISEAFAPYIRVTVNRKGALYAANLFGGAIYKADANGTFKPLVGSETEVGFRDGQGTAVRISQPTALATDGAGNIYFADGGNHTIRKITPDGLVATVSGWSQVLSTTSQPTCVGCSVTEPRTLAVDESGTVFVGAANQTLLKSKAPDPVSVLAGMIGGSGNLDGIGEAARFGGATYAGSWAGWLPAGLHGVALDAAGNAYVSDPLNSAIRKITKNREVITLVNSIPTSRTEATPLGVEVDPATNVIFSSATTVSMIAPSGQVTVLAGKENEPGNVDGSGEAARFGLFNFSQPPRGINALTRHNSGAIIVSDSGNNALRMLTPTTTNWNVSTLTSFQDESRKPLKVGAVAALASDANGNVFAIEGYAVRKFTPEDTNWIVSTIAGSLSQSGVIDGPGPQARFGGTMYGLAVDKTGNVFVSDTSNNSIRKISTNGFVTTLAGIPYRSGVTDGTGPSVGFDNPRGIAVDDAGNLYVADFRNFTLRKGFPAASISNALQLNEAGAFSFNVSIPVAQPALIQSSTNLFNWNTISTNAVGGLVPVADEKARDYPARFYRVMFP